MHRGVQPARRLPMAVMALSMAGALLLTACSPTGTAPGTTASKSTGADLLASAIATDLNGSTATELIRGIIVRVDGRTRYERYYRAGPQDSRSVFSVTKSVISTLIGIAISEGKLSLDDRLSQLLPGEAPRMPHTVARVTLRQLLTMTAGFPDTFNGAGNDELGNSANWTRYILAHQDHQPGKTWAYSDYGVHLLSPILQRATGRPVLEYAREKLFDPLGIVTRPAIQPVPVDANLQEYLRARFAWPVDPQGYVTAAANLKLTPRDMAAFGQLFLDGGAWQGRRLVPASWVRAATSPQANRFDPGLPLGSFDPTGYGFLWWIDPTNGVQAYHALGYGGQLIEVVPRLHLVVVISSEVDMTDPGPPALGPDDTQRLVDVIVKALRS